MRRVLHRATAADKWATLPSESVGYQDIEKELQKLLFATPDIIPGRSVGGDVPLAAISELVVTTPGQQEIRIDIVALDALANIYVVECKMAANSDISRKVLAQVLEYGANLWEFRYLEFDAEFRKQHGNVPLVELITEGVDRLRATGDAGPGLTNWNPEEFQEVLEANLSSGRFTLLIAVDEMNPRLGRTLEYLNTRGDETRVLALELFRLQFQGHELLVPQLSGGLAARPATPDRWDRPRFLEHAQKSGGHVAAVVTSLVEILQGAIADCDARLLYGSGREASLMLRRRDARGTERTLLHVYPDPKVSVFFAKRTDLAAWYPGFDVTELAAAIKPVDARAAAQMGDSSERRFVIVRLADLEARGGSGETFVNSVAAAVRVLCGQLAR